MKLPNAEQAIVNIAKLGDYSLDAAHEEGKHKARVFAAALGIDQDGADWLRTMLLAAALRYDCVPGRTRRLASGRSWIFRSPKVRAKHKCEASGMCGR